MFRGILLVFLGACSFGILSTFVKLAYKEGYTLGDVSGTQVFFGFVILWGIVLLRRLLSRPTPNTTLRDKLKLVAMGTSTGLVSIFYYKCVQTVPASIAILLLMQFTWISLLLESILRRKLPKLSQVVMVLLILLGTAMAGRLFSGVAPGFDWAGIGYGLLAAACYSVFLLVSGTAGNNLHPTTKSALILTGATMLVLSIFPPVFLINGALGDGLLKWGVLLGVFGTVIPPLFFAYGIPRTGLGLSAILSSAELPVAMLMSYLVLREDIWLEQWLGVALILAAIVLSNLGALYRKRFPKKLTTA